MTTTSDTPKVSLKEGFTNAKALLARKGGWTKGELARDANGVPVEVNDAAAVKFCVLGAAIRGFGTSKWGLPPVVSEILEDCIMKFNRGRPIAGAVGAWNDAKFRKKALVLKVMDCAIAKGEEKDNAVTKG